MSLQHLLASFLAGLAVVCSAQGLGAEPIEPQQAFSSCARLQTLGQ
jgi:hypothetical protein